MEEMTRDGQIVDEVAGEETADRGGTITSDADAGGGGSGAVTLTGGLTHSILTKGRLTA